MTDQKDYRYYGGNEMSWTDNSNGGFQFTFPKMFSYLGNFVLDEVSKKLGFEWHSTCDGQAFNNSGKIIHTEDYQIDNDIAFDTYLADNSEIFTPLKSIVAKEINLPSFGDGAQIKQITVSPTNELMIAGVYDKDGNFLASVQRNKNTRYHELIAANPEIVFGIVGLARAYDLQTRGFFKTAEDVPLPTA